MRPQTPFIWSIETPPSMTKAYAAGDGSLQATVPNVNSCSPMTCGGQWRSLPAVLPLWAVCCASASWVWTLHVFFLVGCAEGKELWGCLVGFLVGFVCLVWVGWSCASVVTEKFTNRYSGTYGGLWGRVGAAAHIVPKAKCFHGNTAASASSLSFRALQREGQRNWALGFLDFSCDVLPLPHRVSVKFKELKHH